MSKPKLYYHAASPASRAVLLTIQALNIDVDYQIVNLLAGEQFAPEYLKLNPQHTVPTLQEGGFAIWDSHVINAYLVGKYGKDDSLYPKDLQKRAIIDQRLHFDSGILFPRIAAIIGPILREGAKTVPKEKADALQAGYAFLETFLEGKTYVAGDTLSIADFNIIGTITQANLLVPIAANRYPQITKWINKMQTLPYYADANQKGLDLFANVIKSKLS
ncbi:glutathione S-transferase [Rhyzopertha dominica]|nr:glutathione S-transferase [Rhyzopertha dominica]